MDNYSYIANAHAAYIDELYKTYQQDPESVDFGWRKFFEGYDFSVKYAADGVKSNGQQNGTDTKAAPVVTTTNTDKEVQVRNLIYAYRSRGHLRSKTNPIRPRKDRKARLDLADFNLSEADLDIVF